MDEYPLIPNLYVYPNDDVQYSGITDHRGVPLVRYRQPIGFIDFKKIDGHSSRLRDTGGSGVDTR